MSHLVIAEHCLSRLLVLFYPLINCCAEKDSPETRMYKGGVEERDEKRCENNT